MSVLNEITKKLADLGLGTDGVDIVEGMMPATPDACCAVYRYGGLAPEHGFGSAGIHSETPGIQVVFRGDPEDYSGPDAKAQTAYEELSKIETQTLTGSETSAFYRTVHAQGAPFELKRDENKRVYIAVNFLCEKEPSA
jgi:hypothetical protein